MRRPAPKIGEWRVARYFAWLPTRVGDEYVWLEWYYIREQFREIGKYMLWSQDVVTTRKEWESYLAWVADGKPTRPTGPDRVTRLMAYLDRIDEYPDLETAEKELCKTASDPDDAAMISGALTAVKKIRYG